jgi:tripeptide aminopeptidase
MKECFENAAKKFGADIEFGSNRTYSSYKIDENHKILDIIRKAAQSSGNELRLVSSGGGSDTNVLNVNGIPSVNVGIGMEKVHTVNEFIKIDDMVKAAQFMLEIVKAVD